MIFDMWKTKEEFDIHDKFNYKMGRLMISKTVNGKLYYKI